MVRMALNKKPKAKGKLKDLRITNEQLIKDGHKE